MSNSVFIKNLYTKCRIHGTGEAQVAISNSEIYALITLALTLRVRHFRIFFSLQVFPVPIHRLRPPVKRRSDSF